MSSNLQLGSFDNPFENECLVSILHTSILVRLSSFSSRWSSFVESWIRLILSHAVEGILIVSRLVVGLVSRMIVEWIIRLLMITKLTPLIWVFYLMSKLAAIGLIRLFIILLLRIIWLMIPLLIVIFSDIVISFFLQFGSSLEFLFLLSFLLVRFPLRWWERDWALLGCLMGVMRLTS